MLTSFIVRRPESPNFSKADRIGTENNWISKYRQEYMLLHLAITQLHPLQYFAVMLRDKCEYN
ncbi:AA_kinase domain-containing protein [Psidium guajava]|nr:AA_kinase domain-containing protein [Psidium guajava]